MAEVDLKFPSATNNLGKVIIDPVQVSARGNLHVPWLVCPLVVSLHPVQPSEQVQYNLLQIGGELFVRDGGHDLELGQFLAEPVSLVSGTFVSQQNVVAKLVLDKNRIEYVEKVRRGDDLTLALKVWGLCVVSQGPGPGALKHATTSVMPFTIPQSHWVRNVLPKWGYGQMDLVEIALPGPSGHFTVVYDQIKRADGLFAQGNDDEALVAIYKGFEEMAKKEGFKEPDQNFFDRLLASLQVEDQKKEKLKNLLRYSCEFLHLGRHAQEPPVRIDHRDVAFALRSAKVILAYLSTFKA